jgi:hypothetical protein
MPVFLPYEIRLLRKVLQQKVLPQKVLRQKVLRQKVLRQKVLRQKVLRVLPQRRKEGEPVRMLWHLL